MKLFLTTLLGILIITIGATLTAFCVFSLFQPVNWDLKGVAAIACLAGLVIIFIGIEVVRGKNLIELIKDALGHI